MANENQKQETKTETEQPITTPIAPATPLELSDEELGQVVGGVSSYQTGGSGGSVPTGAGGLPSLTFN